MERYGTKEVLTSLLLGHTTLNLLTCEISHTHSRARVSTQITESRAINCHEDLPISEIFYSRFEILHRKKIYIFPKV